MSVLRNNTDNYAVAIFIGIAEMIYIYILCCGIVVYLAHIIKGIICIIFAVIAPVYLNFIFHCTCFIGCHFIENIHFFVGAC